MAGRDTPARRSRRRRDPAIFQPPPRPSGDRFSAVRNLTLVSRGRRYPIAANVEGQTPWSMGMDQTGTIAINVRDPTDSIVDILDDEAHLQQDGVRITINAVVYVIDGVDHDGEGLYTLTLVDEVSWRLKQFSSYRSANRSRVTRFGFIRGFVDEASRKPMAKMRAFIPEVDDRNPIRKPKIPR